MKLSQKSNFIFATVIVVSLNLLAQSAVKNSDTLPLINSSGAKLNESANTAKSQNDKAKMVSQIVGAGMMAMGAVCASQCSASGGGCCSMAPMYFMMGAQSFQQASANGKASGYAGITGSETSISDPFGSTGSDVNHLDPNYDSTQDKQLSSIVNTRGLNTIKKDLMSKGLNGIKMDPKTGLLTTKDGKSFDPSKLTDQAALSAAGFSNSQIATALDTASKIEAEALKKLGITNVGIGAATAENGYTDGGGASKYASGGSMDQALNHGSGVGNKIRNPANTDRIAGLTKNFNGERIGVSAENIFNMMSRRYLTKQKQDAFIDPSQLTQVPQ